jgi:hypothetical protein
MMNEIQYEKESGKKVSRFWYSRWQTLCLYFLWFGRLDWFLFVLSSDLTVNMLMVIIPIAHSEKFSAGTRCSK